MKIKLTKELKAILLTALKDGVLDTEKIQELRLLEPARILTREEAKQFIENLEKEY